MPIFFYFFLLKTRDCPRLERKVYVNSDAAAGADADGGGPRVDHTVSILRFPPDDRLNGFD